MRNTIIAAAITALFGFSAIAQEKLSVKGSDTINAKLMPRFKEAYRAAGNDVEFEIEDKGSGSAFTTLDQGTADIGASSRAVKDSEVEKFSAKGQKLTEFVAAIDMVAVVVNEKNKIDNLTLEQVEGIFTGEITDWSEVGGRPGKINCYTRNTTSGTYASFKKLAMSDRDYGEDTQSLDGNNAIVSETAGDKNGIGYVGKAYVKSDGLKVLSIDGVEFKDENKASYPIARNLYYYTVGVPKGTIAEFLIWALHSDTALEIIADSGFIPNK